MCAGNGTRWDSDTPKQLALIDNEPNIIRTINKLLNLGVGMEKIFVTVNEQNIVHFPKGLNLVLGKSEREIDRFRNTFSIIDGYDKIIYLYGDVIYFDEDLEKIISEKDDSFLGRSGYNERTKKAGEIFAVVITDIENFIENVNDVADKFEKKILKRELGWEVFNNKKEKYKFVELSKDIDDYDYMSEYNLLKQVLGLT